MAELAERLLAAKALIIWGWLALVIVVERLRPLARPAPDDAQADGPHGWRRLGRNAVLWLINAALSPLVVVPVSLWAATTSFGPLEWRGEGLGFWPDLLIDLLILDLFIYWWHRANHELPILWRFHEVHHLDHFLDASSAGRFHFGEVVLSAGARAVVIIAFDVSWTSVLIFETLLLVSAIFHHSNYALSPRLERVLSWVIVTPSIHWIHHHAIRADTDSNYAAILSVWDRIFGSRSRTARTPDMPIGVEGRPERSVPGLLVRPFEPGG